MATAKPSKKRTLKRAETVRQKVSKPAQPVKSHRVRRLSSGASRPFKGIANRVVSLLRPLGFLLAPFRTRPIRLVGKVLARVLLLNYIALSWKELRQVSWPTRKQTVQLTLAVFAFALFFGVIIAGVDFLLDKIFKSLIL